MAIRVALVAFTIVIETWVGRIGLGLATGQRSCGSWIDSVGCVVVREGHVDLTVQWVHSSPLWTVHFGRAQAVGCQAGIDHHIALVGVSEQGIVGVQAVFAESQFQPSASTVSVELGHIQSALVQVLGARGQTTVDIFWIPNGLGDKLEDVFVARIVTLVHDDRLAGNGRCWPCAFMVEATQSSALDGHRGSVKRIDFNVPAKVVGNVAVVICSSSADDRRSPTGKQILCTSCVPQVRALAVFWQAITLERDHVFGCALGVVSGCTAHHVQPVFFASQVRAPRGVAIGAVVVGAACLGAIGREFGDEPFIAFGRARECHFCCRGDAAVVFGAAHHAHVHACAALDFCDAHAVGVDFFFNFTGHTRSASGNAGGVQTVRLNHVLMVHAQQTAVRAVGVKFAIFGQAEVVHAIVAIADAAVVRISSFAAIVLPGLVTKMQGITQGVQDADLVSFRHSDHIVFVLGNSGEAQHQRRSRG